MRAISLLATSMTATQCLPKPFSQASQVLALASMFLWILGVRFTPADSVGLVENIRIRRAGPLAAGKDSGEVRVSRRTGTFRSKVLRKGLHFKLWPWRYRVHRTPYVEVPKGTVGYVYARDDRRRDQDAPQDILREGTYAIHLAEYFVVTRDRIYSAWLANDDIGALAQHWQHTIGESGGFDKRAVACRPCYAMHRPQVSVVAEQEDTLGFGLAGSLFPRSLCFDPTSFRTSPLQPALFQTSQANGLFQGSLDPLHAQSSLQAASC